MDAINETDAIRLKLHERVKQSALYLLSEKCSCEIPSALQHEIGKVASTGEATLSTVMELARLLRKEYSKCAFEIDGRAPPMWVHELMQGCQQILEGPREAPSDPVVQSKLAELRAQQANREYAKMVRNVTETSKDRWAQDTREMKGYFSQLSVGLNIIASMATTLTAGYFVGVHWWGYKPVVGVAIGVIFMTVVLMAEMWLFIIRSEKMTKQVEKEKKQIDASSMPVFGMTKYPPRPRPTQFLTEDLRKRGPTKLVEELSLD